MSALLYFTIAISGILILGIVSLLEHRKKLERWTGVLVDKKVKTYVYRGKKRKSYVLHFKKDDGKSVTLFCDTNIYENIAIGERVKKLRGIYYPIVEQKKEGQHRLTSDG